MLYMVLKLKKSSSNCLMFQALSEQLSKMNLTAQQLSAVKPPQADLLARLATVAGLETEG